MLTSAIFFIFACRVCRTRRLRKADYTIRRYSIRFIYVYLSSGHCRCTSGHDNLENRRLLTVSCSAVSAWLSPTIYIVYTRLT